MQRTIVQPADLTGAALADLKSWLGITRPVEDGRLVDLLQASVDLCEAFTGQAPLAQTVEERFAPAVGRHVLSVRPVQSVASVELIAEDRSRSTMNADDFRVQFSGRGAVSLDIMRDREARAIAVRVVAGIADDWASMPSALKQGVIRMAAHHYRDRDRDTEADRSAPPPASVAALWRPWRSLRLA